MLALCLLVAGGKSNEIRTWEGFDIGDLVRMGVFFFIVPRPKRRDKRIRLCALFIYLHTLLNYILWGGHNSAMHTYVILDIVVRFEMGARGRL